MTERAHKEARLRDDEYGRDHFTDENMDAAAAARCCKSMKMELGLEDPSL